MRAQNYKRVTEQAMSSSQSPLAGLRTKAELMDYGLEAYRFIGWPILRETFVPSVLMSIILITIVNFITPAVFTTSNPDSRTLQLGEVVGSLAILCLLAIPAFALLMSYSAAVACAITEDYVLGRKPDIVRATTMARRKFVTLTIAVCCSLLSSAVLFCVGVVLLGISAFWGDEGTALGAGIISSLGLVAISSMILLLPIATCRHGLVPAVVILEDLKGMAAVRRGKTLLAKHEVPQTDGRKFVHPSGEDVFGSVWGLIFFLVVILSLGFSAVFGLTGLSDYLQATFSGAYGTQLVNTIMTIIPMICAIWACVPIWGVISTLSYMDRRVRVEGLDVIYLAEEIKRSPRGTSFIP